MAAIIRNFRNFQKSEICLFTSFISYIKYSLIYIYREISVKAINIAAGKTMLKSPISVEGQIGHALHLSVWIPDWGEIQCIHQCAALAGDIIHLSVDSGLSLYKQAILKERWHLSSVAH